MSAWHLLWIVPLSACVGAFITILMVASSDYNRRQEAQQIKKKVEGN